MITELKRIQYTCDFCERWLIEERPEVEVGVLPDDWATATRRESPWPGLYTTETRHYCDQVVCLFKARKWEEP